VRTYALEKCSVRMQDMKRVLCIVVSFSTEDTCYWFCGCSQRGSSSSSRMFYPRVLEENTVVALVSFGREKGKRERGSRYGKSYVWKYEQGERSWRINTELCWVRCFDLRTAGSKQSPTFPVYFLPYNFPLHNLFQFPRPSRRGSRLSNRVCSSTAPNSLHI